MTAIQVAVLAFFGLVWIALAAILSYRRAGIRGSGTRVSGR